MIVKFSDIQQINKVKGGYLIVLKDKKPIYVKGYVDVFLDNTTGCTVNTLDYIIDNQEFSLALNLPLMKEEEE